MTITSINNATVIQAHCFTMFLLARPASANSPTEVPPTWQLDAISCAQELPRNLSSIQESSDAPRGLQLYQEAPKSGSRCPQDAFPEAPRGPRQGSKSGSAGPRRVCDYVSPKRIAVWGKTVSSKLWLRKPFVWLRFRDLSQEHHLFYCVCKA